MNDVIHIDRERLEQAADWLLKVHASDATPEHFTAMLAWCDEDPANKAAFERIEDTWAVTGELEQVPWPQPEEIRQLRADVNAHRSLGPMVASPVAPLYTRLVQWLDGKIPRRWTVLAVGVAAATVMVSLGLVLSSAGLISGSDGVERISTARGGHESARLPDGSKVELGGKTSVAVLYTDKGRMVVADDGEAYYQVSKDPSRPFVVRAGPVTVTAVGTAFTVRRTGDSVSVVVTEGVVDVRTDAEQSNQVANVAVRSAALVRAEAGQHVRYDRGQLSQTAVSVSAEAANAWRQGRLQFVNEPLRLVVASINRYSERELVINDPVLEDMRFTGTVFENGIDSWLAGVSAVFPVKVLEVGKKRVLIAPAAHSTRADQP